MSGTSEIGAMYRQLLSARGVQPNGENLRRVVEESRRTPGLIPGLTVQGMDEAPPNQSAASMPTQSGVPNSGVAPPMTPRPTQPLPVPPAPPSYGGLPTVENVHPGATSPGGVIPGTGVTPGSMPTVGPQAATPSSPISVSSPMSAPPTAPSAIAQQVLGGTDPSQSSSPMSMSLPHMSITGSLPGLPQPSPAGGGMDSSDIAQLILGLGAAGGAGVLGPWASAMHGPSGGGAEFMGNAGHAPFNITPDRQAPTTRPASQPTSRSSGLNVGESGNAANDIELDMGAKTQSPKDTSERTGGQSAGDRVGDNFPSDSGVHGGAVVKTERAPSRVGRSPTFRGIRIR